MATKLNDNALSTRIQSTQEQFLLAAQSAKTLDLALRESEIKALEVKADALVVANEDGEKGATDLAMQLKAIGDNLEDRRKSIKEPGLAWGKMVDAAFKPLTDKVQAAVGRLRLKVQNYRQKLFDEQRRKEEEERRAFEKQAEMERKKAEKKGQEFVKPEFVPSAAPVPKTTVSSSGATSTAKLVWTFEVVKLDAVPMDYWELNRTMIQDVIDSGVREIPGLRIFQRPQVAFRG
jgi:hypothetical protein